MIINSETDYAIRMVHALSDNKIKSVQEICTTERLIPQPFAYKVLKKLEQARIVESFRGTKGGYRLIKKTSELTLLDIMQINKSAIEIKGYSYEKGTAARKRKCPVNQEFKRLENILAAAFRERTLDQIFEMKDGPYRKTRSKQEATDSEIKSAQAGA